MSYRIFLIFIPLFISACASTQSSPPFASLSPRVQREILINKLQKAGVRSLQVGDEVRFILANQRFFNKNTDHLQMSAYPLLNELIYLLNQQKNLGIEVVAYTPSEDLQQETTELGKQQAVAIANYLLAHGLDARLITANAWDKREQRRRGGVQFTEDQPQIFAVEIRTRHLRSEDSN